MSRRCRILYTVNEVARQLETADTVRTVGARHRPLSRAVLDALRDAIIAGAYQPGERLVEDEIAARFGVSRNPIRDALHLLATEGFVTVEPRRGARVASLDATRTAELFELRAPLEGLVCGLTAVRRAPPMIDRLLALVDEGQRAVRDRRLAALPALNTQFHGALALAAQNLLLQTTLGHLSNLIRWVYARGIGDRAEQSWAEHAVIVEAVVAGDRRRAEVAGFDHIVVASHALRAGSA
ncbi:GntR family transcriptional regulator [soil metagenome]